MVNKAVAFISRPQSVKVNFFRRDLGLSLDIPRDSIYVIPSDVEISSLDALNDAIEMGNIPPDCVDISYKILITPLPPIFLPVTNGEAKENERELFFQREDGGPESRRDSTVIESGDIWQSSIIILSRQPEKTGKPQLREVKEICPKLLTIVPLFKR